MQGHRVPKRVVTILEGESLVNDASGLIVFRFALAAILVGNFNFLVASKSFLLMVTMGILTGLIIAGIVYVIHRFLPTTPAIDSAITIISPYIMYIAAEHFHYSGVLSVVTGGLFLSFRSHKIFSYESRLSVNGLWETLVVLLNGLVFILIGLQLPHIIKQLGNYSAGEAITYGVIISVVTIVIRILWVFPGAYLPRMLFKSIRKIETKPNWRAVFLTGWSGMRGVVSLASALAIPLTVPQGYDFRNRNLILFITFVVILFTLVLQGLSLKPLIRYLKLDANEEEPIKMQTLSLRIQLAEAVLAYLDTNYSEHIANNDAYRRVRDRYERMIDVARKKLDADETDNDDGSFISQYRQMLVELVDVRRKELNRFRNSSEYDEELIREREWELDLEEARLRG